MPNPEDLEPSTPDALHPRALHPLALHPLAQQLLDAQVRHHLAELTGERLGVTVAALADDLLTAVGAHPIGELVDAADVKAVVVRSLATVPGSAAVSGFVELGVSVAREGPGSTYALGELVDRDQVERVVDEALALHPLVERTLERLTASPLVGAVASRYMGRVVAEVVQANRAVTDRLPGLGSLMTLGTTALTSVVGAADKQLEGLLGDAVGKGGTYAVRRLNRIIVETLRDPTTRDAVLQVWDLAAAEPVAGIGGDATTDELAGLVDAVHELVVTILANERVAEIAEVVVDAFFERFGGYSPTELLDELDLDRADLVADLVRFAPGIVAVLADTGDLERIVRARLEPFYASPEVGALLS